MASGVVTVCDFLLTALSRIGLECKAVHGLLYSSVTAVLVWHNVATITDWLASGLVHG